MEVLTEKEKRFIEYATVHGFWKALRDFKISDKSEWGKLQKLMSVR